MKFTIYAAAEKCPDTSSWFIMRWMRTPYSHVFVVLEDRMYHAVDRGVCDDDFEEFCKDHHLTEAITLEVPVTKERFLKWYEQHKGKPYSDAQFLGFAIPGLKWLVRNKRAASVCSEFVCWFIFDFMGWAEFDEDADFKDPKTVMEMLKRRVNGEAPATP